MTARREPGPPAGRAPAGEPAGHLGAGDRQGDAVDDRRALLSHALERAVIPRLLQAHATVATAELPDLARLTGRPISAADVRELTRRVLLSDDLPAREAIEAFQIRGIPREILYTDLLTPTARMLGVLWEQDLCNFVDVTVGVGRLQQALRDLSAGLEVRPPAGEDMRRVLLVPAPGEQHTFGLVVVAEFFRGEGWEVIGGPHPQLDPVDLVRREWVHVVGFSLASETKLDALRGAIAAVRKASLNPQVGVLVGGPIFLVRPGYADEVGADAVAVDGSLAPGIAVKLLETRQIPC